MENNYTPKEWFFYNCELCTKLNTDQCKYKNKRVDKTKDCDNLIIRAPIVGEKVKVFAKTKRECIGVVTEVNPPNEYHTGRFIVCMKHTYFEENMEFRFTEYGDGRNVQPMNK